MRIATYLELATIVREAYGAHAGDIVDLERRVHRFGA